MVYLGNNWPAKYRNGLFTANFHGRRLNMDTVHRAGNSYVGHHGPDFMKTSDPWFRGVEMIYGPDGGVFILDWSDIGECHENDGIHRTSGRIFKVVYGRPEKPDFEDLSEWTDDELIALLEHDNDWYVRQARRLLQERSLANHDGQLGAKLLSAYHASSQKPITAQLRYLWAVYSTGNANDSWLIKQTWHANEHVRSWAIRMLADGLQPISPAASQRMIQLATQDPSGLVRLYLASSLSRLNSIDAFRMATELSKHNADAQDRVQPHLVWFGIEPFVIHHPDAALQLARNSVFPLIRENIVRRLTGQFAKRTSVSTDRHGTTAAATNKPAAAKFDLSKITAWLETETDPGVRKNILAGMAASLNGWLSAEAPDGWEKVSESLLQKADEETRTKINEINLVFGSGRTFDQLVKLAADSSADVAARRDAIEMLGPSLESRRLFDLLRSLITDKSVATQVTKSFVHCDNPAVARLILARYPHMQPSGKAAAINTLVARSEWTQSLLNAIEMGQLPREQLTASHARQIKNFENPDLTRKLNQVWGEVRESTAEKSAQMEKMKDLVYVSLSRDVDLHNGKILFEKHCVSCHILYGKGGKIGPDLTGSDRKNLSYLAENLVDPSASVAESYRSSILQLEDGRLITGIVVEENDRTVKVQTKDELVTLDRDSIEQSKKTKLSLMPDGLLDPLSNEEIVNLFRYLMTSTQTE
jgi:putative heme-binding domain-containing protein